LTAINQKQNKVLIEPPKELLSTGINICSSYNDVRRQRGSRGGRGLFGFSHMILQMRFSTSTHCVKTSQLYQPP